MTSAWLHRNARHQIEHYPERCLVQDGRLAGVIACDTESKATTKIFLRPDGTIQINPYYWEQPFAEVAQATLQPTEKSHEIVGGRRLFNGKELRTELLSDVRKNIDWLAVYFYLWSQKMLS